MDLDLKCLTLWCICDFFFRKSKCWHKISSQLKIMKNFSACKAVIFNDISILLVALRLIQIEDKICLRVNKIDSITRFYFYHAFCCISIFHIKIVLKDSKDFNLEGPFMHKCSRKLCYIFVNSCGHDWLDHLLQWRNQRRFRGMLEHPSKPPVFK